MFALGSERSAGIRAGAAEGSDALHCSFPARSSPGSGTRSRVLLVSPHVHPRAARRNWRRAQCGLELDCSWAIRCSTGGRVGTGTVHRWISGGVRRSPPGLHPDGTQLLEAVCFSAPEEGEGKGPEHGSRGHKEERFSANRRFRCIAWRCEQQHQGVADHAFGARPRSLSRDHLHGRSEARHRSAPQCTAH